MPRQGYNARNIRVPVNVMVGAVPGKKPAVFYESASDVTCSD